MDLVSLMRIVGALAVVLGLLGGGVWALRRFGAGVPGLAGIAAPRARRRLEVAERLALDPKRSVVLLRADTREYVVLLAGDQATVLGDAEAAAVMAEAEPAPMPTPLALVTDDYAPRPLPLALQLSSAWHARRDAA